MTWDILVENEYKPKLFRNWIKRVYLVSSALSIEYNTLWEMTEVEFLELEKIAHEELAAKMKKVEEMKNSKGQ